MELNCWRKYYHKCVSNKNNTLAVETSHTLLLTDTIPRQCIEYVEMPSNKSIFDRVLCMNISMVQKKLVFFPEFYRKCVASFQLWCSDAAYFPSFSDLFHSISHEPCIRFPMNLMSKCTSSKYLLARFPIFFYKKKPDIDKIRKKNGFCTMLIMNTHLLYSVVGTIK